MFDFQFIDDVLNIDPSYIALFAAMIFGVTQAVKGLGGWVERNALIFVIIFSLTLSTVIVMGWSKVIAVFALAQLIATSASGLYGWGKKADVTVELPDYSDES